MNNRNSIPGWIGTQQAIADYAGVSKRTVQRWITDGTLKVRHLSAKKIVCRPADVDKAVKAVSDRYEMEAK